MRDENINTEYKSIKIIKNREKGFKTLAETCVAFANTQGGTICIGVEDHQKQAPAGQRLEDKQINEAVNRVRSLCSNVAIQHTQILVDEETGGEYFKITVAPSQKSIATTSDGKIYQRVGDQCIPVRSEDIAQLSESKGTYQWELVRTKFHIDDVPPAHISQFVTDIRESTRVSDFVKLKTDLEILEHYHLIDEMYLSHIGVLWLGNARMRAHITYAITVQYIVYDDLERKVRKHDWHAHDQTPKDLLLDIEAQATELTYFYEFPDGLFRKAIPHYNKNLIRELLVNAFAHKSFTISQDVLIALYSDRVEITSPGGLPAGITAHNILHQRIRRNPNMIEIFKALGLMEGEGSGYDMMYEINAKEAKNQPEVISDYGMVRVIQLRKIIDKELLPLLDYVSENYNLTQKGLIAFGTIAQARKILSTELAKILQLSVEERLRSYTDRLIADGLIIKRGMTKGSYFSINPKLIEQSKTNIKTTLKTLEPHVLKALVKEDLRTYPDSKISEIDSRLQGVEKKELIKTIYAMVESGELLPLGAKRNRTYRLNELAK